MRDTESALELCRLCPKLCHSSCPVADADGQESSTPWGKMSAMKMIDQGELAPEYLSLAYKCLNCGNSERACELDNPVAETLNQYRAKAFTAMMAPKKLYDYCEKFSRFNNPYARDLKKILMRHLASEFSESSKEGIYFPGCHEIAGNPKGVKKTFQLFRKHGVNNLGLYREAMQCCGAPLFLAGDWERFRELAEVNSHLLNEFNFIVINSPECLHTLKHRYAPVGFPIRAKLLHFSQFILPLLTLLKPPTDTASQEMSVAYHDSCHLGRRLGIYQEPRKILELLLGKPPLELIRNQENSYCCGAGGLLPLTFPESAGKITLNRLKEFNQTGASLLVTAAPECQKQFLAQIPYTRVVELKDFILKRLHV